MKWRAKPSLGMDSLSALGVTDYLLVIMSSHLIKEVIFHKVLSSKLLNSSFSPNYKPQNRIANNKNEGLTFSRRL